MKKVFIAALALVAFCTHSQAAFRFQTVIEVLDGSSPGVVYDTTLLGNFSAGSRLVVEDIVFQGLQIDIDSKTNNPGSLMSMTGFLSTNVAFDDLSSNTNPLPATSFSVTTRLWTDDLSDFEHFTTPQGANDGISSPSASISGSSSSQIMVSGASTFTSNLGGPIVVNAIGFNIPGGNTVANSGFLGSPITWYTIEHTVTFANVTQQSLIGTNVTLTSSVIASAVPEPTSLALAGFAGIGMAVGAIRRRRQAKQAA